MGGLNGETVKVDLTRAAWFKATIPGLVSVVLVVAAGVKAWDHFDGRVSTLEHDRSIEADARTKLVAALQDLTGEVRKLQGRLEATAHP